MTRTLLAMTLLLIAPVVTGEEAADATASAAARRHLLDPQTPQGLQALFRYTGEPLPLVSAHRGGAQRGFPENCLATFDNTLQHTFAVMEVDPRYTMDGAIVLHHDPRLERTTTGQGLVAERTLAELQQLRLKDPEGTVTEFQMPTLDEALEWARGKTVLILDQKDVPVEARVKKISQHQAEAYAMLIVYSYREAQACYRLNPNIMMEVMVPNLGQVAEFDKLGVPWSNVVAFVGHTPPDDPALYAAIHQRGASCLVGSSRNLDRRILSGEVADIQRLEQDYRALVQRGADLIETDIPTQLGLLLYGTATIPASKRSYFRAE